MPAWMRWVVFAMVLCIGAVGQAQAQEVAPQPLRLEAAYEPAPPSYHAGQISGAVLVSGGLAIASIGIYTGFSGRQYDAVVGGVLLGAGTLVAGIGTLATLAAAHTLSAHGFRAPKGAAWVALSAVGIGLIAGVFALSLQSPAMAWIALGSVPVALVGSAVQVGLNVGSANRGQRFTAGVTPLREGGLVAFRVRF